jgi:hypothetical protein
MEWINVRKTVRQFGTGNRKCRYPERENKVVLTIQPIGLLASYRARRAWSPDKAPLKPGDCLPLVAQHLVPEKGAGKKATAAVLKTRRVLPRAAMREGKRAGMREVQKHKLPQGQVA